MVYSNPKFCDNFLFSGKDFVKNRPKIDLTFDFNTS